jgi:ATP-binding cassette subfamily B protein
MDGFVRAMPDGYDTALARDSPVLVLDEPMTGPDNETAERVMVPLRRLMADRTTAERW